MEIHHVGCSDPSSHQVQIAGRGCRKHSLYLVARQSPERRKQATEHGAIFIEDGIIAILKQIGTVNRGLLPSHASAIDAAAENPVDRAVTMVGSLVAVLAKGAAELGHNHHDGVAPLST